MFAAPSNLASNVAAEDRFVADRQRHRQSVLGGIHQVEKRMTHLQEKGAESKTKGAAATGGNDRKVNFVPAKSLLKSLFGTK